MTKRISVSAMPRWFHYKSDFSSWQPATLSLSGTFALALIAIPTMASAEVCDKAVGENWYTTDGPVWLFNPVGFPFGLVAICVGLALATRLRWVGYLGSAFLLFSAAAILIGDVIPQHPVYLMELHEGCRSERTDLIDSGLFALFSCAYAWFGFRANRNASLPARR